MSVRRLRMEPSAAGAPTASVSWGMEHRSIVWYPSQSLAFLVSLDSGLDSHTPALGWSMEPCSAGETTARANLGMVRRVPVQFRQWFLGFRALPRLWAGWITRAHFEGTARWLVGAVTSRVFWAMGVRAATLYQLRRSGSLEPFPLHPTICTLVRLPRLEKCCAGGREAEGWVTERT